MITLPERRKCPEARFGSVSMPQAYSKQTIEPLSELVTEKVIQSQMEDHKVLKMISYGSCKKEGEESLAGVEGAIRLQKRVLLKLESSGTLFKEGKKCKS